MSSEYSHTSDQENSTKNMNKDESYFDASISMNQVSEKPTKHASLLHERMQQFEQCRDNIEKKLTLALECMEIALKEGHNVHFKEFWDIRKKCIDLFKEHINPSSRVHLWAKYTELCQEARKLKEILDEQTAFAVEQIEIAIKSIEEELEQFDQILAKVVHLTIEIPCQTIEHKFSEYDSIQRELSLLNSYAARTNSLRKELIRQQIRIRQKNAFFTRLSKIGDRIFPRRKDLIQKLSTLFNKDVEEFIEKTFARELKTQSLFSAREEIKALQNLAKHLTINTETFSQTRQRLSECWDSIKNVVKERKRAFSDQKTTFKKNRDELIAQVQQLKKGFEEGTKSIETCEKELEEFFAHMRKVELGKQEIRDVRQEVRVLRDAMYAKVHEAKLAQDREQERKEYERKNLVEEFQHELDTHLKQKSELSKEAYESYVQKMHELKLNKVERQEIERLLRKLKDMLAEKRVTLLQNLSSKDKQAYESLQVLLKEKQDERNESKFQLEHLRKQAGSSGLDFEQAIRVHDLLEEEKARLEKIEAQIEEIEEKMSEFED